MNRFVKFTGYSLQFTEGGCRQRLGGRVARCLLVAALLLGGLTAKAQQYVFLYKSGNTVSFMYNNNGSVGATNTFNASTCIFTGTGTSSSTFTNNGNSLNRNNNTLRFNTASTWVITTYGRVYYDATTDRYIRYYNSGWTSLSQNNNPGTDVAYTVLFTYSNHDAVLSNPTIDGADVLTATGTSDYSVAAKTTPQYHQFDGYSSTTATSYYWYSSALQTTPPTESDVTSGTWVLEGGSTYASVNASTGRISVSSLPSEDLVMTLKCTVTSNGITKTAQKTVVLYASTIAEPTITRSGNDITLATSSVNATIYYTTDGSTPSPSSTAYTGPFSIEGLSYPVTVKAIAIRNGNSSTVATQTYSQPKCATPVISIASNGDVTITCATEGATIRYIKGDSNPANPTESTGTVGTTTTLTALQYIKAIAVKTGYDNSEVDSAQYITTSVSGGKVILDDREDHSWAYYNKELGSPIHSWNPADVKITYHGNGAGTISTTNGTTPANDSWTGNATTVKVSSSENDSVFIYLKTLERTDGSNSENPTGRCEYKAIPNPFSVRPTYTYANGTNNNYCGFYKWRVRKLSGGTIHTAATGGSSIAVGGTIDGDQTIYFAPSSEYGMEVELEALWARAYVTTGSTSMGTYVTGTNAYERNFHVVTSTGQTASNYQKSYPVTISSRYPNGTSGGGSFSAGNFTAAADTKIEHLSIGTGNNNTWTGAGFNFTIGRGVSGQVNVVRGISSDATNTFRFRVESGTYNNLYFMGSSGVTTGHMTAIMGCDYDRAKRTNTNLTLNTDILMSNGGTAGSTGTIGTERLHCTVKSGNYDLGSYGGNVQFYMSSPGQNNYAKRTLIIEGGIFSDVSGGMESNAASVGDNLMFELRVKGGTINGPTYGAAQNAAGGGHRKFIITGGNFKGWIAGGANGTNTTGGKLSGKTYIYFGGKAKCDSEGSNTTFGPGNATGGNIFGAGSGNASAGDNATVGEVDQSTVIIADQATVERNVYGGGNYGYVVGTGATNLSDMYILGGTVNGSVFGGSNMQKGNIVNYTVKGGTVVGGVYGGSNSRGVLSGSVTMNISGGTIEQGVFGGGYGTAENSCDVTGAVNITMTGGTVLTGLYGGGNVRSVITGTTTVNVNGGTVGASGTAAGVYGGGLGQNTRANNSVTVKIGADNATSGATIYGDVYGGSAKGVTNYTGSQAQGSTTVTLNAGTIYGSLYGGGHGLEDANAHVYGAVTVTVNGGKVKPQAWDAGNPASVFGCNNAAGSPQSTVAVIVNATDPTVVTAGVKAYAINGVYGGGNQAHYTYDNASYPTVTINGCASSIRDVYGGGNAAAVPSTHVTINGGDIDRVFGGGNGESGTPAHVGYRNKTENSTTNAYSANGNVSVLIRGGEVNQVFGGSNAHGTIKGTIGVDVTKSGTCAIAVHSLYGGGNRAASNLGSITLGCMDEEDMIDSLFCGANSAAVTGNVNFTMTKGRIGNLFGNNNNDNSVSGTIALTVEWDNSCGHNYLGNIFGGGNLAAYTGTPSVNIYNGTVSHNVFGGGNGDPDDATQMAGSTGAPTVIIGDMRTGKTANQAIVLGDVYGGGNAAKVTGDAAPTVRVLNKCNTEVGYVYGGGNAADVPATNVSIAGGTIGNVFGGGHGDKSSLGGGHSDKTANVSGNDTITITGGTIGKVFAGSNLNGTIGGRVGLRINKGADNCDMKIGEVYGGGNMATSKAGLLSIGCTGEWTNAHDSHNGTTNRIGYELEGISAIYGGANQADVTSGNIKLDINSGIIDSVFGGNNTSGNISGTITVNIEKDDEASCASDWYVGTVFGGGNMAAYSSTPDVNIIKGEVSGNVYGGGNEAGVGGGDVAMTGGAVRGGIYGGCNTSGTVTGNIAVSITAGTVGTDADHTANVHGGGYGSSTATNGDVAVTINGGGVNIYGDVYGGSALGNVNNEASDHTTVTLTSGTIHGSMYGGGLGDNGHAAAVNGAVQVTVNGGSVTGNVYGCNNANGAPQSTVNVDIYGTDTPLSGFALAGVFGGGNQAEYSGTPVVKVHNCNNSIEYVYGGGNAANVYGTDVTIYGADTIGHVFGGCYGASVTRDGTHVKIYGGTIGEVFGGNNQLGSITGIILVDVNKQTEAGHSSCEMHISNVYGGGNVAASGAGTITVGCTGTGADEGIDTLFGGANQANVTGPITLTITEGRIANIFGGNNNSGTITGAITVNIEKKANPCVWDIGNVFGAGNLAPYTGNPAVNVKNGTVGGSVYGGGKGASAVVTGDPVVTIGDANANYCAIVSGNVYGGGDAAGVTGNSSVTYNDSHASSSVAKLFGGGNAASVSGTSTVTLTNGKVTGGLYGGCNSSGSVGVVTIALNGGQVGATGNGNSADVYGGGFGSSTTTTGNINVTLNGTNVYGDLYGGSALGSVNASASDLTTLTISSNTLHGSLFGGGKGDVSSLGGGHSNVTATSEGKVSILYNTANADLTGLYGGANVNGLVKGDIAVNINANVGASGNGNGLDIFGGGYGANTNTQGNVTVTIGNDGGTITPVIYGDIYGGSALGNVNNDAADLTKIDFLNGTLHGNIYGGGLGDKSSLGAGHSNVAAKVYGQVQVNISSSTQAANNCKIDLRDATIYGCNNTNGSPQDNVTVNIYKTAYNYSDYPSGDRYTSQVDKNSYYAIDQVFGGGNQADYLPENGLASSTKVTTVNIYGCVNTIRRVFSGGNAAAATGVACNINGGRFDYIFGGGNGEVTAANIGDGGTNLTIKAGIVGRVFGGSNENGTISGPSRTYINGDNIDLACVEDVDEFFGGGNLADITGDVITTISCGAGDIAEIYGGSNKADIGGNVTLNLYGGNYTSVYGGSKGTNETAANIGGDVTLNLYGGTMVNAFGGSNIKGNIGGDITVNVLDKETSNCQLEITNLYGGCNKATYTPDDATTESPVINLIHINNNGDGVSNNVFGGSLGAEATVTANPQVNIGYNATTMNGILSAVPGGYIQPATFPHAFVGNNVYGGGSLASVTGNTTVILFEAAGDGAHTRVGNSVFGASMGDPANVNTALVSGNTEVTISGGKVDSNIYGGGELAAVGGNTAVTLSGTAHVGASTPSSTNGFVFGGGKGTIDDPAFANVKGNTHVVMTDGYVHNTIFGGGEVAMVGTFTTANAANASEDIVAGEPVSCAANKGRCLVEISGGQVGHKDATLKEDIGYVFGAGMGVYTDPHAADEPEPSASNARFGYVDSAEVRISDSAFIVGAVWGGSENGQVLHSCGVKVSGGQIGNGWDYENEEGLGVYTPSQWATAVNAVKNQNASSINTAAAAMPACLHWPFGVDTTINGNATKHYLPYDPYDTLYHATDASHNAGDGHTFFGNVFGGGSGYYAYKTHKQGTSLSAPADTITWYSFQGRVRGNTYVEISDSAHVLTSVYGGCEYADVVGNCYVTMTGGTIGVPRTLDSIDSHPVVCNLFGAGKGDQRTTFNMRTNIDSAIVKVSGGVIFGSVFGGGEDGHVYGSTEVTISDSAQVGTWGTSYYDGNVFGGGRGFGGTSLTAGSSGGNAEVNISGACKILGSVYGGGRLASVGLHFVDEGASCYGKLQGNCSGDGKDPDDHGNIVINISGGTIGNATEFTHPAFNPATSYSVGDVVYYQNQMYSFTHAHTGAWDENHVTDIVHTTGGNVFGSSMGRLLKIGETDDTIVANFNPIWPGLAKCRSTEINITDSARIYSNVYGGGELGYVMGDAKVVVDGDDVTIGHTVGSGTDICYLGSVYGGGFGSENITEHTNDTASLGATYVTAAMHSGRVYGNTDVELKSGHILGNIYGGGELASVGRRWINMTYAYDPSQPYAYQHPYNGTAATHAYVVNDVTYYSYGYNEHVGNTKVTVSGGKVGEVDNVTVGTHRVAGRTPGLKGSVFGGGKGRPGYYDEEHDIDYGFHFTRMAYVDKAQVFIEGGQIAASVFGGGENGHVRYDASVTMTDGTVGLELDATEKATDTTGYSEHMVYHGNVYGGGRGIDMTQTGYLGEAAGQVFGNTSVTISGGTVRHNVYGGGSIASVGTYIDFPIVPGDHAEATTGKATVTIYGGTIGDDGRNNGSVFGSGRGVAYSGTDFAHKAFVNNTEVNIQPGAIVKGNVFGGGENGHVMTDTKVNVTGGEIGSATNATDWTSQTTYHSDTYGDGDANSYTGASGSGWVKYPTNDENDPNYTDYISQLGESAVTIYYGNVYGGGRGVDRHDDKFSTSAGRVYGNTEVNISNGTVYHNVYGGGSMASVGYYELTPGDTLLGPLVHITHGGVATVNISGGTIGTTGHNNGHVFGSSRGMAGTTYSHYAFVDETHVNISDSAYITGSVFGSGENGHVLDNTYVTMTGGTVGRPMTVAYTVLDDGKELQTGEACSDQAGYDMAIIFRGNVYGGGRGVDRHDGHLSFTAGSVYGNTHVNISGGTVTHNVYGGGSMASVGTTVYKDKDGIYTSYMPVAKDTLTASDGTDSIVYYDEEGKPDDTRRYKDSHGEYTSRVPVLTPHTYKYKTSATSGYTSDVHIADPETGDYFDSIPYRWWDPETEDYTATDTTYYDEVGADTITGWAIVQISGTAIIGNAGTYVVDRRGFNNGRVFGAGRGMAGGDYAYRANVFNTRVDIKGGTVNGSVFGGGENGHVLKDTRVTVDGGVIGHNMNESYETINAFTGAWEPMIPVMKKRLANVGNVYGAGRGCDLAHDDTYSMSAGYVRGNTVVNINGGTIHRNVYGGGSMALVGDYGVKGESDYIANVNSGLATVNILSSVGDADDTVGFGGNVFGSSRGRANDPATSTTLDFADMAYVFRSLINVGNPAGTRALTVYGNVYGGGEAGHVDYGGTTVNIMSGTVKGNVFGGGMGASTSPTAGIVDGNTQVNIGLDTQTSNNVVIEGNVFGGNDAGSSPLGTMQVDVYRTAHPGSTAFPAEMKKAALDALSDDARQSLVDSYLTAGTASPAANYALKGVYGGGNQASVLTGNKTTDGHGDAANVLNDKYITQRLNEPSWPVTLTRLSKVIIHDCEENTVMYVYGGGRAADTYQNDVTIEGGRFYRVFAGGNGNPDEVPGNPGANVLNNASITVEGGLIYQIFGGSNTSGVIHGTASVNIEPDPECDLINKETFGGGNEAPGGSVVVTIPCGATGLEDVYGGANQADITGDVTLNIVGGEMKRAFGGSKSADISGDVIVNVYGGHIGELYGGNNVSGNISGDITVNVDIDPDYDCADGLALTTVYGGGNMAAYTPYDPFNFSPVVNIMNNRYKKPAVARPADSAIDARHADSAYVAISEVYGGGYGSTATATSYPRVLVGGFPARGDGKPRNVRVFDNLYAGGYGAPIVGNPTVIVRNTVIGRDDRASGSVFGGGYGATAIVDGETYVGIFGLSDIKGSVYGGGNAGTVTGNTELQIGYEEQVLPTAIQAFMDGGVLKVRLVSATPDADIYYTTDGSTPSTASTPYSSPFTITWGDHIKAIAYKDGMIPSVIAFDKAPKPAITVDANGFHLDATVGAKIWYTLDGSDPATSGTRTLYGGYAMDDPNYNPPAGINPTSSQVLKAMVEMRGCLNSEISYLRAEIPTITFVGDDCTITGPAGTRIVYTTDGSYPTSDMDGGVLNGTRVNNNTVTIEDVSNNTMIRAIVERDGYVPSNIRTAEYTAPR